MQMLLDRDLLNRNEVIMIYIADLTIIQELDDSLRLEMHGSVDTNSNKPLLTDNMFNMEQEIGYPPTCVYYNKGKMRNFIGIIWLTGFKIITEERKIQIKVKAPFRIEEHFAYKTYQKSIESDLIFEEKDITIHNTK